jgi:dipeptidyl aminopeptidase/acylaminoacyl peptidase
MKELQARIDKLLPATVNRIDVPFRAEVPLVLVYAYSDRDPGRFLLYDTQKATLTEIGRQHPAIDAQRMGSLDLVRYKARDGLEIPAWLTVPRDGKKGPRPMVVLVHGGPWVRGGAWHWAAEAQFLASRGYVVLEPEFRGSRGYGFSHFKAGWKQWGLAMQNDVADGARWAIEKGYADANRICIAGASYGGYAALMGLVNDGDLYRCGFEWVGVTDLDLLFSARWHELNDDWKAYGLAVLIGDPDSEGDRFKATSPVAQASRIKRPVLMGYGERDPIVPIAHGRKMRAALADANADVEWVVYPDDGHGWSQLKDNIDWWTRVEKFLARNIGDGVKQ